eukprot:CAMPEP_0117446082 /NCGR_PEP_ID=MMETSP0759-20121206/6142_1 /TAXON_ID=63605 /ORGANISM="Percolomonas cosmopolitus, Strain WS" /LENGTH=253 /DNA_ID=CAMNT_0005238307 /DNA_START=13 /DNA_END=774 /DNA_ORIENTATION=+
MTHPFSPTNNTLQFSSINPTVVENLSSPHTSPVRRKKKHPIRLHIYNIVLNGRPIPFLFHTGIVVLSSEYAFCNGAGIVSHHPIEGAYGVKFHSSELLGHFEYEDEDELYDILDKMRDQHGFTPQSYHLLTNNCNHHTEKFARELLKDESFSLPSWINQAAYLCSHFSCLIPSAWCRPNIAIEPPASPSMHDKPQQQVSSEYFALKQKPHAVPPSIAAKEPASWTLSSVIQSWRSKLSQQSSRHQPLNDETRI